MERPPLFPYQEIGSRFLSQMRQALLADEMGLGKTAQAITACDLIEANRVLVVCPAVARTNWIKEFEMWSRKNREFHTVEDLSTPVPKTKSVVTSYDLADPTRILGDFDVMILDEAHYLKSINTQRTRFVLGVHGLIRRAKRTWALSGTPAPNHPGELWPLLYTFGLTSSTYDQFIRKFCITYETPWGLKVRGARMENVNELVKLMKPKTLRRKKDEVMTELPEITYATVFVDPSPVDLSLANSFADWFYPRDEGDRLMNEIKTQRQALHNFLHFSGLTEAGMKGLEALSSSVSALRKYIGLQKVQSVADMVIEELTNNLYEKVVIFAIHRDVIEGLRVKLSKFGAVTLYGGTPPEKRTSHINKFQNNKKCRVFIGNIQAAGTAITLTSAHNVIFIEQDWVPGNNAQAAMRCHRIGQTKPVLVRFACLADGLDEKITQVVKRKTKELTTLFDEELLIDNLRHGSQSIPDHDDIFS